MEPQKEDRRNFNLSEETKKDSWESDSAYDNYSTDKSFEFPKKERKKEADVNAEKLLNVELDTSVYDGEDFRIKLPSIFADELEDGLEKTPKKVKKIEYELLIESVVTSLIEFKIEKAYIKIKKASEVSGISLKRKKELAEILLLLSRLGNSDKTVIASFKKYIGGPIVETGTTAGVMQFRILECTPSSASMLVEIRQKGVLLEKAVSVSKLSDSEKLKCLKNVWGKDNFAYRMYLALYKLKNHKSTEALKILIACDNSLATEMVNQLNMVAVEKEEEKVQRTFQWLLRRGKIKSGSVDIMTIRNELLKKRYSNKHIDQVINSVRDYYAKQALNKLLTGIQNRKGRKMTLSEYRKMAEQAKVYRQQYSSTDFYITKGKKLMTSYIKNMKKLYKTQFNKPGKIESLQLDLVPIHAGCLKTGTGNSVRFVEITTPFWMGETEITQGQYYKIMGKSPSVFAKPRRKNYPVENVSWFDTEEFCRKLTALEKEKGNIPEKYIFRLPTSVEWEYCARAGNDNDCFSDEGVAELHRYANYCDKSNNDKIAHKDKKYFDGYDKTAPVKKLTPNEWGLHNMYGNVSEWCYEWAGDNEPDDVDPLGLPYGTSKIVMGGAWDSPAKNSISVLPTFESPSAQFDNLGFRVVLAPEIILKLEDGLE